MSFGFGMGFPRASSAAGGPSLNLQFAGSTTLDPSITFTRASSGSYYNSSGYLQMAAVNLLTFSEQFDNAAWNKTRVSVTVNATISPDGALTGDKLVEDTTVSNTHQIVQAASVISGTAYTFSFYLKAAERVSVVGNMSSSFPANSSCTFNAATGIATNVLATSVSMTLVGNGWYRCALTATANATGSANFTIYLSDGSSIVYTGNGTSGIYIWGAQLELGQTATTYLPTTGTVNGAPRLDYNPSTLQPQGLLIEEARTNSIRNNTGVGAVAGTPGTPPTNCSFTGPATGLTRTLSIGSENGIAYVDIKYVGTASGSTFAFFNTDSPSGIAAATGQVWNGSFYLKLAAGSTAGVDIKMSLLELNSGGSGVVQSLSPILTPTSANLSTQRNTLTATLSGGATVTNLQQGLRLLFTDGPIDITLRIGLPQLELGSFATSVIPTTTAAATRAADNSLMTGTNFSSWYNQSEGTLAFKGDSSATTGAPIMVRLNDGSYSDFLFIKIDPANTRIQSDIYSGGARAAFLSGAIAQVPIGSVFNAATAYKVNDFAQAVKGAAVVTDTVGAVPVALDRLAIGYDNVGSGSYINGHVQTIAYYPRRLSNAELQSITA